MLSGFKAHKQFKFVQTYTHNLIFKHIRLRSIKYQMNNDVVVVKDIVVPSSSFQQSSDNDCTEFSLPIPVKNENEQILRQRVKSLMQK